jgi:hypothetical protein
MKKQDNGGTYSEELHNLYVSPNFIRQLKLRKMGWVGHVWERREKCTGFWWERDRSEDQGIDGRMRLEWILRRLARGVEWIQGKVLVVGSCERHDEPLASGAMELVLRMSGSDIQTRTIKCQSYQHKFYWSI